MIPCLVKILTGERYEYRHSKSIAKPKYKLPPALQAQFTNKVDLKDGLLNDRDCTLKFLVV